MGLLTGLLGLPLAPIRGTIWVADQVLQEAERQYYDPAAIRRSLEEIEQARQRGDLSEDEARAQEEELIERLLHGPPT